MLKPIDLGGIVKHHDGVDESKVQMAHDFGQVIVGLVTVVHDDTILVNPSILIEVIDQIDVECGAGLKVHAVLHGLIDHM